ncbi:hypothetical protein QOT17_002370 [Balamuthia mandrillaris]
MRSTIDQETSILAVGLYIIGFCVEYITYKLPSYWGVFLCYFYNAILHSFSLSGDYLQPPPKRRDVLRQQARQVFRSKKSLEKQHIPKPFFFPSLNLHHKGES